MVTSTDTADFVAVKAKINELKDEARKAAKLAFAEGTKNLFLELPEVNGFGWSQYTPYFNDGEPCEFSASTDYAEVFFTDNTRFNTNGDFVWSKSGYDEESGEDLEEDEFVSDKSYLEGWVSKEDTSDRANAIRRVHEFLGIFDDDDYFDLFGDHVQVIVRRDGEIEVNEYSHD